MRSERGRASERSPRRSLAPAQPFAGAALRRRGSNESESLNSNSTLSQHSLPVSLTTLPPLSRRSRNARSTLRLSILSQHSPNSTTQILNTLVTLSQRSLNAVSLDTLALPCAGASCETAAPFRFKSPPNVSNRSSLLSYFNTRRASVKLSSFRSAGATHHVELGAYTAQPALQRGVACKWPRPQAFLRAPLHCLPVGAKSQSSESPSNAPWHPGV